MKRVAAFLILALIVIAACIYLLGHKAAPTNPAPAAAPANSDARALTQQETSTFLPLFCTGATTSGTGPTMTGQNYQYYCASLPDYPRSIGIGSGLTLTSIIYGHMTNTNVDQAYISYQGNFEPHLNNWGGGILFGKDSSDAWQLTGWYPGGQMNGCLALTPSGQAKMLCLFSYTGQGEVDTSLWVITIPPSYDPDYSDSAYRVSVLKASDERQTGMPNDNCSNKKSPGQAILLSIGSLARSQQSGIFAQAAVQYAAAADATSSCAAGSFESVKTTPGAIDLKWDGKTVTAVTDQNFAPASW